MKTCVLKRWSLVINSVKSRRNEWPPEKRMAAGETNGRRRNEWPFLPIRRSLVGTITDNDTLAVFGHSHTVYDIARELRCFGDLSYFVSSTLVIQVVGNSRTPPLCR